MMHLRTASRLHFGLLSIPLPSPRAPNVQAQQPHSTARDRSWGGIGLMISHPGIILRAEPAGSWEAAGPLHDRVLAFCKKFFSSLTDSQRASTESALKFTVERSGPEHQGLGTGTQLGLAVARILAEHYSIANPSAADLAVRVGRGRRSAIGIHGFDRGGFLVEAGKSPEEQLSPLINRLHFPDSWTILVITRKQQQGLSGIQEKTAFERLQQQEISDEGTDTLCRLVLMGILPELVQMNLRGFGEALFEYNRRVGMSFKSIQGGVYSHPQGEAIADWFRQQQVHAVGQSSWGPAMFAVVEDVFRANYLAEQLIKRFALDPLEITITQAANQAARFTAQPG